MELHFLYISNDRPHEALHKSDEQLKDIKIAPGYVCESRLSQVGKKENPMQVQIFIFYENCGTTKIKL